MTEDEWQVCINPDEMLKQLLSSGVSDRKLRLFEVACCRRLEHLVVADLRDILKIAERLADGLVDSRERKLARGKALLLPRIGNEEAKHARGPAKAIFCETLARRPRDKVEYFSRWSATAIATYASNLHYADTKTRSREYSDSVFASESLAHADLLREMFGNPFSQLPERPRCDEDLLEQIYNGKWNALGKLESVLRKAGCSDQALHCLRPASLHVRGCWLIDWLTGRE